MHRIVFASTLLASLAGCSLIPHYDRPGLPTATDYPTGPAFTGRGAPVTGGVAAGDLGWRDFFVDPVLQAGTPVYEYEPGAWGPAEVHRRIAPVDGWNDPVVKPATVMPEKRAA